MGAESLWSEYCLRFRRVRLLGTCKRAPTQVAFMALPKSSIKLAGESLVPVGTGAPRVAGPVRR